MSLHCSNTLSMMRCGLVFDLVRIDELDLGVFLVVVLNQFQATIFIIPYFV